MPLYKADDSIDPYTLLHRVPEEFIIFYSSITEDGQMWCPVNTLPISPIPSNVNILQECRAVEGTVKATFEVDGLAALVVYVGNRAQ